jgi:hypothetical protein
MEKEERERGDKLKTERALKRLRDFQEEQLRITIEALEVGLNSNVVFEFFGKENLLVNLKKQLEDELDNPKFVKQLFLPLQFFITSKKKSLIVRKHEISRSILRVIEKYLEESSIVQLYLTLLFQHVVTNWDRSRLERPSEESLVFFSVLDRALKRYPDNYEVQSVILRTLPRLRLPSSVFVEVAPFLMAALRTSTESKVVNAAIKLTHHFFDEIKDMQSKRMEENEQVKETKAAGVSLDGFQEEIKKVMQKFKTDARVTKNSLRFALTHDLFDGVVERAIEGMEEHPKSPGVQYYGCKIFSESKTNTPTISLLRCLKNAITGRFWFSVRDVTSSAVWVAKQFCWEYQRELLEAGFLESCLQVLDASPSQFFDLEKLIRSLVLPSKGSSFNTQKLPVLLNSLRNHLTKIGEREWTLSLLDELVVNLPSEEAFQVCQEFSPTTEEEEYYPNLKLRWVSVQLEKRIPVVLPDSLQKGKTWQKQSLKEEDLHLLFKAASTSTRWKSLRLIGLKFPFHPLFFSFSEADFVYRKRTWGRYCPTSRTSSSKEYDPHFC